jgi:uroporphyrin-III C-methyltransferase/precorrin-2 dehydrogenase/sirohydrochlorin ferrochelatase
VQHYPAFLQLRDRKCLIVGDDHTTSRQAMTLASCGARIHWIKQPGAHIEPTHDNVSVELRRWHEDDLGDCWLVIANTDDDDLNRRIGLACEARRLLCHIRAQPALSTFAIPAIVDRSPLMVAISSGGVSPILSRVLKSKIETLVPAAYARLAEAVGRHRQRLIEKMPAVSERSQFWHSLLNGPIGELAFNAGAKSLDDTIARAVDAIDSDTSRPTGHVSLVGAGPGDPDLLTFRALRLVQSADVIVYDRLVSSAILDLCRSDAQMIYAGKARAKHAIEQGSINQLLVDLARDGNNVVRLKGGDPFIFGRGGEEIETLAANGIGFQVVPGITAAAGCAAFGGIPLTHRDHAQSCVFVTGHLRNGQVNMNWQDLQDPSQTIVVYMGLVGLGTICQSLIDNGRDRATPAALIEQGTTPSQRVLCGTLESLPQIVQKADVNPPTLLIIGSVVTLRDKLTWFHPAQV